MVSRQKVLAGLVNQRGIVPIVQAGWVRAITSHKLVPGDIVVLQEGTLMCDMVLLRGNCLVEEPMISGEVAAASCTRAVSNEHAVSATLRDAKPAL